MKKTLFAFASLMMLFGFVACKTEVEHEHTFAEAWTTDETYHWHAATCEHAEEVSEKAEHTFDEGKVIKEATEFEEGEKTFTCTVCGYKKVEKVDAKGHSFSIKHDDKNHWYECACGEKKDEGTHTPGELIYNNDATEEKKGTKSKHCTVCGYEDPSSVIPANGPYTPTYTFTESVKKLPDGTNGTAGTNWTYVEFGDFPKTIAASDIQFNPHAEDNGYYAGSDGNYYAKVTVKAYSTSYKYTDGTDVTTGDVKYFKVEPIKWRVLTEDYNSTNNALLLAENELTANVPYYESYSNHRNGKYENNYEHSQIRAYLNGISYNAYNASDEDKWLNKGFLQTAFTTTAQEKIETTTVINNGDSTTDADENIIKADGSDTSYPNDYTCDPTDDRIFLLSEQEVTTSAYGFDAYDKYGKGNSRIRVTTDFAKANNAYQSTTDGYGGWWWLRSPIYYNSRNARYVNYDGYAYNYYNVDNTYYGVVPALSIKLQ